MAVPAVVADNKLNKDCPKLVLSLLDYSGKNFNAYNDRLALLGRTGFLRSKFGANFKFLESEVSKSKDKRYYKASLHWMNRFIASDLPDCSTVDLCAPEASTPYISTDYTFTPYCTVVKETMTIDEFRKTCDDQNSYHLKNISMKLQAATRAHEEKVMAGIISGAGDFNSETEDVATGTQIGVSLATGHNSYTFSQNVMKADGTIDFRMLHDLREIMLLNEMEDGANPIMLMDYVHPLVTKVATVQEIGCCSDIGVDQQAVADAFLGFARFASRSVGNAMVTASLDRRKDFYVLHPGAAHYIEYHVFDDPKNQYRDGENYGTLYVDPLTGEEWDHRVHFEDCPSGGGEPVYVMSWVKRGYTFTLPSTLYKTGDYLEGVNGIFEFSMPDPV